MSESQLQVRHITGCATVHSKQFMNGLRGAGNKSFLQAAAKQAMLDGGDGGQEK